MRKYIASPFMPKLLTVLFSGYSRGDLRADLIAGLTVALVALPLSIALGIASGATPAQGLITAIVGGFFISLLGGSRVQIGGPTGAFIAIIYGILPEYGYDGLVIATALAGAIMVIAGYLKFGQIIKYVPLPVVTGFTSGIAVIIVTAQVKDFFGLTVQIDSADFLVKWRAYLSNLDTVHPAALAIGSLALVIGIACRKLAPRLPRFLIALVICSAIVAGWSLPVETVGSRYPELSAGLSVPAFPAVTLARVQQLLPPAFAIAFLAGIEALLSAVVADGMTGYRHRPNQELVGQGIANLASACVGGLPATGAIARTATNISAGAKSPLSGMFHSLFLLLFVCVGAGLMRFIPMPVLAAILFLVAAGMSEAHRFLQILRLSGADRVLLCATFLLTVFVDLTVAIAFGVTVASLSFAAQMSKAVEVARGGETKEHQDRDQRVDLPEGADAFYIEGPIFFGIAGELIDLFTLAGSPPKVLIIRMGAVPYLDASGAYALVQLLEHCQRIGTTLVFSSLRPQPERLLKEFHPIGIRSEPNYGKAVELARDLLS